jgi:hypothetical protein
MRELMVVSSRPVASARASMTRRKSVSVIMWVILPHRIALVKVILPLAMKFYMRD